MLERGTILAGYRIDGVLGEGGMAVVYRATQLSLKRVVALKLLSPQLSQDPNFRARFEREGQLQAGIDHPHIVAVHEAGESEQGLFLAMRLVPGPTLKELILGGQLDPRRSVRLLTQVGQALDAAHEAGLIHRDVKPQNILVDRGDHVYLADFGLTKVVDDETSITQTGQFLGTIDYASPEQIRDEPATRASDCYALAGVLYECLVGRVPFPENNEAAVLHAHLIKPPPRPTERRGELPAAIDDVIASGMAKDPAQRPDSCSELMRMAAQALFGEPLAAPAAERRASPTEAAPTRETHAASAQTVGALTVASPVVVAGAETRTHAFAQPAPAGAGGAEGMLAGAPVERRTTRRRTLIALAVALTAALAAVGAVIGSSGKSKKATFANVAAVGHLELRYPDGWQPGASVTTLPGMTLAESLTISAGSATGVLAGEARGASGVTLLPASFRGAISGALPPAEPVRLGAVQAYRYAALHVRGVSEEVTVFVAPTSAGAATIACLGRRVVRAECERVAATLRLLGTSSQPLGPSGDYASSLSRVLRRLGQETATAQRSLTAAGTPDQQAGAERALASAAARAAGDAEQISAPLQAQAAHSALTRALRDLDGAYGAAAAAARSGDQGAYAAAGRRLSSASKLLADALRELQTLGYTLST